MKSKWNIHQLLLITEVNNDSARTIFDRDVVSISTRMEDIAAEISSVKAEISAVKTEIAGIRSKRNARGLSDPEQAELTALTIKEAAHMNKEVELLKCLPVPGIRSVSFISNRLPFVTPIIYQIKLPFLP